MFDAFVRFICCISAMWTFSYVLFLLHLHCCTDCMDNRPGVSAVRSLPVPQQYGSCCFYTLCYFTTVPVAQIKRWWWWRYFNGTVSTLQCGPALHYFVDLRIQTYRKPIPLKYGILDTKSPTVYEHFYCVSRQNQRCQSSACRHQYTHQFHLATWRPSSQLLRLLYPVLGIIPKCWDFRNRLGIWEICQIIFYILTWTKATVVDQHFSMAVVR